MEEYKIGDRVILEVLDETDIKLSRYKESDIGMEFTVTETCGCMAEFNNGGTQALYFNGDNNGNCIYNNQVSSVAHMEPLKQIKNFKFV